jgi:cytochrome c-type biogenesis protein CcmH/NrfF
MSERLLLLAVALASCLAFIQGIAFGGTLTREQQSRVAALEGKLLAPCCYQEPVGRHQSEVALRMRLEIARFVEEGRTEPEIIDSYVQRYGAKVVADFAPTPGWARYVPWLLSIIGAAFVAWWIRRMVRHHAASESQAG